MTGNVLEYLDWRGDLSFAASGFCEVDNLVFSMLSFVDFTGIVPSDGLAGPVRRGVPREVPGGAGVRRDHPGREQRAVPEGGAVRTVSRGIRGVLPERGG